MFIVLAYSEDNPVQWHEILLDDEQIRIEKLKRCLELATKLNVTHYLVYSAPDMVLLKLCRGGEGSDDSLLSTVGGTAVTLNARLNETERP